MSRVKMKVDPAIPGDAEHHMWTRVTVRLTDGRTWSVGPREVPGHPIAERTFDALIRHGWVEEAEPIQGAKRWRISEAGLVAARIDPVRRWL
jgi:hypothetical protein